MSNPNPYLTHEELAAAEATCVAEMYGLCLDILHDDARQILAMAEIHGGEHCAGLVMAVLALTAKIESMKADMTPLLGIVQGKDALAKRDRTGALVN